MFLLTLYLLLSLVITLLFYFIVSNVWWILLIIFISSFIIINGLALFILYLITLFFPYYKIINGKEIERKSPFPIYKHITYLYSKYILLLCKVKMIKKNLNLIPSNEPYLVILNHQSILDPLCFIAGTKVKDICFLMKQEIKKIPLVGKWLLNSGHYYLNRQNNREGIVTILNSINAIKNGRKIGVFIEGTRSHGPNLNEFHDATLKMALKTKCKIVVCVVDNNYNIFKNFLFKQTKVLFKVCDVISAKDYENKTTKELSDEIRQMMQKNLDEERNRVIS